MGEKMLQYTADDIDELFGSLDWPQRPDGPLTHDNKRLFVSSYIEWFFTGRYAHQFSAFSSGFFGALGRSKLLRFHFDAEQLEAVVCGGTSPVDIAALEKASAAVGWDGEDKKYLKKFWSTLAALDESDRRRFLVFATASDRMPLQGWGALKITVQKNGTDDDRLPTAFTCFATVLVPVYTTTDKLRGGITQAINNSQGFGLQ